MEHRAHDLFKMALSVALLLLFVSVVEARRSESCQCFLLPGCSFDDGKGYRYRECRGSCAAYGGWTRDYSCYQNSTGG
ncbi:hypothetical protein HY489_06255 [Candidatus Woesearchaeota archaeon]|nr:hypothetical protein [Candidatus Woesearchaeota archaeon]